MFCKKCGVEISDDFVYCPKCGQRQVETEPQTEKNTLSGCLDGLQLIVAINLIIVGFFALLATCS